MMVAAERLLGLDVVDARGQSVGAVVDVGTGEGWNAKFLLVQGPLPRAVQRVEMRDVAAVRADAVLLRA